MAANARCTPATAGDTARPVARERLPVAEPPGLVDRAAFFYEIVRDRRCLRGSRAYATGNCGGH